MNLFEETERIKSLGYNEENAQSKLGQDIILKAIADSGMARNATIKGGVVMRSISNNSRRATQDLDLDFIRYSISNDSIRHFVKKLNCIDDLTIKLEGNILELNHQDYKGKRIFISVTDAEDNTISLKMDLGVHNDLSIEQEEYAFDVGFQEDAVSLLINSPAQMITEKLKSMVRFGSRNTRYKDVFDICYLSERVKMDQLTDCIQKYIFDDDSLKKVSSMNDIVSRIERMFTNTGYLRELRKSDKNWLDISIDEALEKDLDFIKSIPL
ncbi:MAG: nucleotidyl transferase AbiEii/AbiGii toxin family protein [Lachnospiraceae bacterium]|nr:nucleotidyl transferase AbiEii/AbiGii toxin family protein [Lachnospiraceae bacterium]